MESHSKICCKCKGAKPRTEFNKHRKNKDGLQGMCKVCTNEYNKQYRQKNREQIAERQKQWRQENRERIAERNKRYYQENREQLAEYYKQYYQENREQKLERIKQWRQENPEYNKKYLQENPEKNAAYCAKRRALKQNAIPDALRDCPIEKGRLEEIYKLRDLLTKETGVEHHVDHIWPLSKGGPHWSGNLQVIPAEENLSKNASFCEDTARVIEESLYENLSARQ